MTRHARIIITLYAVALTVSALAQKLSWGDIDYHGKPWVKNISQPYSVTHGLEGRSIALWASHGRYYDNDRGFWRWQRPRLFATCEDLFTPTVVTPLLIPMLEKAGAVVFTPRERDWQRYEVIVDNDNPEGSPQGLYIEVSGRRKWTTSDSSAFALPPSDIPDGYNPFRQGTARQARTTTSQRHYSETSYQPTLPATGRYAVYVSYLTEEESVDDAEYTVWHQGQSTLFHVNQQMGGRTWVYLGTFTFDKGSSERNRVVLTNRTESKGVVTTDAVRFGGGMGNIIRGDKTSGLPRYFEGARYYAQWAGMPDSVYSTKGGVNDYGDDINSRSLMTDYLGGGSPFMPDVRGLKVPIELSLAVHSDAGYDTSGGDSITGTLSICTTDFNDGLLSSGLSRYASCDFADLLRRQITQDMSRLYGRWNERWLWDRNYSETRLPAVPSAIVEMLSHQNFNDMRLAQDPNVRFHLARAIYKAVLRFICAMHGIQYVVAPLPPKDFSVTLTDEGQARLSWTAVADSLEPSAVPTAFIVYTGRDGGSFDNGTVVRENSCYVPLDTGVVYNFRVAALNSGGESMPTEQLSALRQRGEGATILIINAFRRLASPQVIDNDSMQGFDLNADFGVSNGPTAGWAGHQLIFSRSTKRREGEGALGYTGQDLEGQLFAGNDFTTTGEHAAAIALSRRYNVCSTSLEAIEDDSSYMTDNLARIQAIDIILGLQRDDGYSLKHASTFPKALREGLVSFLEHGGAVFASGAYIGRDVDEEKTDSAFLADGLSSRSTGSIALTPYDTVTAPGGALSIICQPGADHYWASQASVIEPVGDSAFPVMYYSTGDVAAIGENTRRRLFIMGFPIECVQGGGIIMANLMASIFHFLLQ